MCMLNMYSYVWNLESLIHATNFPQVPSARYVYTRCSYNKIQENNKCWRGCRHLMTLAGRNVGQSSPSGKQYGGSPKLYTWCDPTTQKPHSWAGQMLSLTKFQTTSSKPSFQDSLNHLLPAESRLGKSPAMSIQPESLCPSHLLLGIFHPPNPSLCLWVTNPQLPAVGSQIDGGSGSILSWNSH